MPKTIAELRQDLQDAGRDVRMAGEMVERVCNGTQLDALIAESLVALTEARRRILNARMELMHAREAAK